MPPDAPPRTGVLVTRPEPGLADTMAAVERLGWQAHAMPALRIEPIMDAVLPLARTQAVLLTSGQAIAALAGRVRPDIPILAVGAVTARRMRDAGFTDVTVAAGTAADLADLARDRLDPGAGSLLVPTAPTYGQDLAVALRRAGFRVSRRCVYRVRPAGAPDAAVRTALAGGVIDAALFYSAETARQFLRHLPAGGHAALRNIRAIAISQSTEAALSTATWRAIQVAARPDQAAILDRLGRRPAGE
ncbi:uroporphyrinogen-III synthase [Gluconacetobacter diazotrophicus]|uniref:Uroporphyrinogen-III synthase n=1 Tax=Gluconacetobacter diazotrophicus TaxID=33996 RepID=A0A7W4FEF8_GLUDI|nr:uroporphyrinogen-III synthase [Gluconacetobacter diazotrophicus]MBB2156219.1 uroporphyrinogen-III synthase [Gluconacetobacter diazotrophicus]